MKKLVFISLIIFAITPYMYSQQTFKASILAGVNPSQIQGDEIAGYDYLGLVGGLRVDTRLSDKFSVKTDFLYSKKGSTGYSNSLNSHLSIKLTGLDIPVAIAFRDWYNDVGENSYYRLHFEAGLTYSRLIDVKSEGFVDYQGKPFGDYITNNLFEWHVGTTFYINNNWGVAFRYNRGINNLINNKTREEMGGERLKLFYISLKAIYTI